MVRLQRLNVVKVVESEDKARSLIARGFKRVEEADVPSTQAKDVDQMTVAELEQYADERGIDLSGCKTKAEKLAKIKEAEGDN